MSLDVSAVGYTTDPYDYQYDWKNVVLYYLGVGGKREELDYLYEARGPKVLPTFAVVPAYPPLGDLLAKTKGNLATVVHGGQLVTLHRPIPPEGTLKTVGKVQGIYDLKKMAQVVLQTRTEVNGEPCFDTEWSVIFRGAGGFGGSPPPKQERPAFKPDVPSDVEFSETTSPEQALLYRLSGDLNPLHADPEFAKMVGFPQGPILHGLCSYGFVARAIVKHCCEGDADRLVQFGAQFRKPVWPGDTIRTQAQKVESGVYALRAYAGDRPDAVITHAFAKVKG